MKGRNIIGVGILVLFAGIFLTFQIGWDDEKNNSHPPDDNHIRKSKVHANRVAPSAPDLLIPRVRESESVSKEELFPINGEVAGILKEIEIFNPPVDTSGFRKAFSEIFSKIVAYPEPFRSTMLDSLSERICKWGSIDHHFDDARMIGYVHLLLDCADATKIQGGIKSKDLNLENVILGKLADTSLSKMKLDPDSYFENFEIKATEDPIVAKLATMKASLMFLRSGGDIKETASKIQKGELRNLFVKQIILMEGYLSPTKAAEMFLSISNDVKIDPELANATIGAGIRNDPEGISKVIASAPPGNARDKAVLELIRSTAYADPERAAAWIDSINSPKIKQQAATALEQPRDFGTQNEYRVKDEIIITDPDKK